MNFEYTFQKLDNVNIVKLKGDLIEKGQATQFLYELDKHIEKKEFYFILDLAELKYMNSTGLNVLINVLTKSRKSGGDVAIVKISPKVNELLTITKLNSIFNLRETLEEAVQVLNKKN